MTKLIITRGIPGSGKSTWARAWAASDTPNRLHIERDMIRQILFDVVGKTRLSDKQEQEVTMYQANIVHYALKAGVDVCVADTNTTQKRVNYWKNFAQKENVDFEIVLFDTPLDVCLYRNSQRLKDERVPESVIYKMNKQLFGNQVKFDERPFIVAATKKQCFVFDVDGTLALMNGRNPYNELEAGSDYPNTPVMLLYHSLVQSYPDAVFIVLSGRKDKSRDVTTEFLESYGLRVDYFFMRKDEDNRKDAIVKREIYESEILPKYNVVFHVDDRQQVVDEIRNLGVTVLQVAPGKF